MKSSEIIAAIRYSHGERSGRAIDLSQWAIFEELRVGTGYGGKDAEQRIDVFVMNLWPSTSLVRKSFEVKVSRADFLKELRDPMKRRRALLFSNKFYFATPPGLVKPDEIPIECGLVEAEPFEHIYRSQRPTETGFQLRTVVEAPWRDTPPPTWRLFAAIARRVYRGEQQFEAINADAI